MTRKGGASSYVVPSIVTCRSCIASSSAACVFGGARLISSESKRFVKIGPGRNSKSPSRWFQIDAPVTSEGMRSGVNWMRVKRMLSTCANERAARVFARPGKSSSSTCPLARKPQSTSSSACRFPTIARSTSSSTRALSSWTCSSSTLDPLQGLDDLLELAGRDAASEAVLGWRTVRPHELPRDLAEDVPRRLRLVVEGDAAPGGEELGRERPESRAKPVVEVERAGDAQMCLLLDPLERLGDRPPPAAAPLGSARV